MDLGAYRPVLANRDTRQALLLGFLIRVPMWAGAVILTLHVVTSLGRSYGEAGLVTAASTVAVAVSGPWRGRLLDRIGLRRTVGPSLVVQAVCWSIAPWLGYAPLIAFAALAGLFVVPTFSILRQVIIRSVPSDQRRTALSLDSSATELSFMAGPAIGVWLATSWDTGWALLVCELTSSQRGSCCGWSTRRSPPRPPRASWVATRPGSRLPVTNRGRRRGPRPSPRAQSVWVPTSSPRAARSAASSRSRSPRSLFRRRLLDARPQRHRRLDRGRPAHLRGDRLDRLGARTLGRRSLVGGLLYGAWHRSFSVFWLLGGLAATTAPVALATGVPSFAVLITVSGFLCAPTITATVEQLSRQVPERFRGEMMGWHGSAMTAGSAVGAPVAGFAIDHGGWQWGFVVVSALGVVIAAAGLVGSHAGRQRVGRTVRHRFGARGHDC